jgi:Sec-independent protein translocase protein TatA
MFGIGMGELFVLLMLGLVLFGNHLPRIAHLLGSSVAAFKSEARRLEEDIRLPAG